MFGRKKHQQTDNYYPEDEEYNNYNDQNENYENYNNYYPENNPDNNNTNYDDYSENTNPNEDPSTNINLISIKRSNHYMKIGIIGMILATIIAGTYFFLTIGIKQGNTHACWNQEAQIEQIAKNYISKNGLSSYPAYIEDIPETNNNYKCPDGGTFHWNPINGTYTCDKHGHYPQSYVTPTNQTLETKIVPTTQEK
jgi:hypothetical protein